ASVDADHVPPPPPPPPAPTVTVLTPPELLARPSIRLQATCASDPAYPCTAIDATVNGVAAAHTDGTPLDSTVSLAAYDGPVGIEFTATNAAGKTSTKGITAYTFSDPRFTFVDQGDGPLLDIDDTRLLFLNADGISMTIRDRASRADTLITNAIGGTLTS